MWFNGTHKGMRTVLRHVSHKQRLTLGALPVPRQYRITLLSTNLSLDSSSCHEGPRYEARLIRRCFKIRYGQCWIHMNNEERPSTLDTLLNVVGTSGPQLNI